MDKKKIEIIYALVIIILIIIVMFLVKNKKSKNRSENLVNTDSFNVNTSYDNETGLYYIKDEETGEIKAASSNPENLEFYKEHPDYDPNPLSTKSTDIHDFVYSETGNEVNNILE